MGGSEAYATLHDLGARDGVGEDLLHDNLLGDLTNVVGGQIRGVGLQKELARQR